jgi:hypothetical protein
LPAQEFRKRTRGVLRNEHDFAQVTDLVHGLSGFVRAAIQFQVDGLVADGTHKRFFVAIYTAPSSGKG